jgi:homoserine dehydrogenase
LPEKAILDQVKIGICGLGTVGYGSYLVLAENKEEIARRAGCEVVVSHIGTRSVKPEQEVGDTRVSADVFAVADDPEVNIVLELIGGEDLAKDLVLRAVNNGKHVVTANKALIAVHGNEIFEAAARNNVCVAYEAAVAGGIPVIKAVREGMAANRIEWLAGIINGTGNFILTEMRDKGSEFADVLRQAQELGYAEADPTFDVEGIDAAHKLTILASIAFGIPLQFKKAYTEGITQVTIEDIHYAEELGYRIKHLGIARNTDDGIELRVHPTLISEEKLIANVDGVMNAVMVQGNAVGPTMYCGAGAGALPTASAVVADVVDVVRVMDNPQSAVPTLAFQNDQISDAPVLGISEIESAYYLRIAAEDKAGVLSDITEILGDHSVNIEAVIQKEPRDHDAQQILSVIILTHEIKEAVMIDAIGKIEALEAVSGNVSRIRMDKLE